MNPPLLKLTVCLYYEVVLPSAHRGHCYRYYARVNWNVKFKSDSSSQVSVVTWISLRKFCGENKIKSLKIFLNLDNYEQKGWKSRLFDGHSPKLYQRVIIRSYYQLGRSLPHSSGPTALQSSGLGPFGRIGLNLHYYQYRYHYCFKFL